MMLGKVLVAAATALLGFSPAQGAAPMPKTQPGFYRTMLGDFEITALSDGVINYPTARVLPTATPEQIKSGLSDNGLTDPVGMSYNAFLINTGSKLALIDTGTGGKLDDEPEFHGAGHLTANLLADTDDSPTVRESVSRQFIRRGSAGGGDLTSTHI